MVPLVLSALAMCALAAFMSSHAGLAFAALMVTGAVPGRYMIWRQLNQLTSGLHVHFTACPL